LTIAPAAKGIAADILFLWCWISLAEKIAADSPTRAVGKAEARDLPKSSK